MPPALPSGMAGKPRDGKARRISVRVTDVRTLIRAALKAQAG